ncbi:kat8 regulatory nsl complex subunit 3-like, partial [Plakobranchus ocellatus]
MASVPKENASAVSQRYMTFSQRMSNELNIVSIDHCYAKPWSSHPDASNARPLQMLFMEKFSRQLAVEQQGPEDVFVDVDGEEASPPALYDVSKARAMMSDCDRHASSLRPDFSETKEDWEDHIASIRTSWSVKQNRIFAKVMKILQADRLARLSIIDTKNEPIQRRLQIDKAAKRIRFAFGNIGWDKTLTLWLHNLLLDKLRGQLLTSYLEVLQKLKAKVPSLIDRLMDGISSKQGTLASESLSGLLKRNWDPVINSINQQKLKKLPENPLLLFIPGPPISPSNPVGNKRQKFWQNQLASMGKVINVVPINNDTNMPVGNCVENMVATTRSKILEMKGHFPGRLIVLIGWNIGALVALHVSLVEVVHAVVCIGFPTMGISGNRGEVDDTIYNCKTPTLFVVGQHASATNLDCLEDIRERLRVETGLVLVGGTDDQLRMTHSKKRSCGLTQAMVDRCIMEEMYEFLGNALFQVIVQPDSMGEIEVAKKHQKKRKHKDMSSTAGSQTIDSIAKPTKKIKTMKVTNVGAAASTGPALVANKRSVPKKRLGKMSTDGRTLDQKPLLHLTLPVIASKPVEKPSASKPSLSEAAAIASAPELSTLLQSIKTTSEQALVSTGSFISSKISSSAATSLLGTSSSTVPTTTALTLSKFLASTSFLKGSPFVQSSDLTLEDPDTELDAKLNTDPSSDIELEDLPDKEDSPVKNQTQQQQPQILIRTGPSSSSFSIPLTFSMASRALKCGTTMKLANSGLGLQQVHQLLTTTANNSSSSSSSQNMSLSGEHSTLQSITSVAANTKPNTSFEPVAQPVSSPETSNMISPSLASVQDLPKASVINIGNDTVYLKETPPSKTCAPGTVSIDLGQIASSNSVKLPSSSKISLIPSMRHIPLSISSLVSSSSEITQAPSPASFPRASLISQTQNQQLILSSKSQPRFALSSPVHLLASTLASDSLTPKTAGAAHTVAPISPQFGLSRMSSSQLLSSLSSSAGVIRFKVASPLSSTVEGSKIESKQLSQGKDETDGHSGSVDQNSDPFAKASKLPAFIDLTDDNSPPSTKQASKTVTALSGSQTLSLLSMKSIGKSSLPNLSLTSNTGNKCKQASNQCFTSSATFQLTPVLQKTLQTKADVVMTGTKTFSFHSSSASTTQEKESHESNDDMNKTMPPSSLVSPSKASSSSTALPSPGSKSNKSSISYTAKPKTVLSSVASTRTRRIKVPKQYDL